MGHIRDIYPEFEKRGARVVVILAQKQQRIHDFLQKNSYPFPVLADSSREVVKEYGVYVRVNLESVHIARPANFVLDSDGTIRYIFIASVQTEYAKDADILAALDA
jgi:peroxiredoxin Q/BCP